MTVPENQMSKFGVLETRMKLLIYTTDVMPSEEVTQRLGIEPTTAGNKGDSSPANSLGRIRQYPHNHWFLSSDSKVKSESISEHMDWFLEKLRPAVKALSELIAIPQVKARLVCIVWVDQGVNFAVSSQQLLKLSEIGLPLEFEILDYGDKAE